MTKTLDGAEVSGVLLLLENSANAFVAGVCIKDKRLIPLGERLRLGS